MKKWLVFAVIILTIAAIIIWQKQSTVEANPNLRLINQENPIPDEAIPTDLVNLYQIERPYQLFDSSIELSSHVVDALANMIHAANKDGLQNFIVMSGYRSVEAQQKLYDELGAEYAMKPGYSEHHSGLALDIGSTETTMDLAPEGKWIEQNAHRFGFILRYPAHKTAITGIEFEPWHLRYVGLPYSEEMYEQDLVLEEYLTQDK